MSSFPHVKTTKMPSISSSWVFQSRHKLYNIEQQGKYEGKWESFSLTRGHVENAGKWFFSTWKLSETAFSARSFPHTQMSKPGKLNPSPHGKISKSQKVASGENAELPSDPDLVGSPLVPI